MQPIEPFELREGAWTPVSPRLATARRTVLAAVLGVVGAAAAVAGWLLVAPWLAAVVVVVVVALGVWGWWVIGRSAAAWGYTERDRDLLIRRGIVYRQLVVVPYGRMQYVDVQAGPVDRAFKIASVQLHTAAAATDAQIPGLPPEEAARLRDRLASRGEAQSAGL